MLLLGDPAEGVEHFKVNIPKSSGINSYLIGVFDKVMSDRAMGHCRIDASACLSGGKVVIITVRLWLTTIKYWCNLLLNDAGITRFSSLNYVHDAVSILLDRDGYGVSDGLTKIHEGPRNPFRLPEPPQLPNTTYH